MGGAFSFRIRHKLIQRNGPASNLRQFGGFAKISIMKYTCLTKIILTAILIAFVIPSYSQSRSGIGIAYGVNKPFSNDYNFGSGFQFLGNVAIGNKWAITPDLGYDRLNSKGRIYYDPHYLGNRHISDLDLFHLGISGKYYFNEQWFAKAGATLYAAGGNEDIAGAGIGGSATAGYILNLDEHNNLELSFSTDVIKADSNGTVPFAGLKVAYVFNFKRK
jgi:hypothetical protein